MTWNLESMNFWILTFSVFTRMQLYVTDDTLYDPRIIANVLKEYDAQKLTFVENSHSDRNQKSYNQSTEELFPSSDSLPHNKDFDEVTQNISKYQHLLEFVADKFDFFNLSDKGKTNLMEQLAMNPDYAKTVAECQLKNSEIIPCDSTSKYRTYDGSCNNLAHPRWGKILECMPTLMTQSYEGSAGFRKSVFGNELPNSRHLSASIALNVNKPLRKTSHFFTFFGQILTHDISLTPILTGIESLFEDCCQDKKLPCIKLDTKDPFYSPYNVSCLKFARTGPCRTCTLGKRKQLNQVTSAIDASFVYGVTEDFANSLRAFDGTGKLLSKFETAGEMLLPNNDPDALFCPKYMTTKCFLGGDPRVNQHSILMILQTIFLRLHNILVDSLKTLNPFWTDEKLYQEGRRILGAMVQNIVYREYLPIFLFNPNILEQFDLLPGLNNSTYNGNMELGVFPEFSGATFRIHSMVNKDILLNDLKSERFLEQYSNPDSLHAGYADDMLSGLCRTHSQNLDRFIIEDLTNFLYKTKTSKIGFDMQTVDIERGRDLGLPSFAKAVDFCSNGSIQIKSFEDLVKYDIITAEETKLLQMSYRSVEDVDLILGLQLENLRNKNITHCISAHQFHNLKFADRFFFTHGGLPTSFTNDQIQELLKVSISGILCQTTNITHIQRNVFNVPSSENPVIPCSEISTIDLSQWKE